MDEQVPARPAKRSGGPDSFRLCHAACRAV